MSADQVAPTASAIAELSETEIADAIAPYFTEGYSAYDAAQAIISLARHRALAEEVVRGNFVAVTTDEPQINNWHTAIYEDDYKGLLIAVCNQNGRYPWQVNAILAGLNAKREAGDALAALSHPEPVAPTDTLPPLVADILSRKGRVIFSDLEAAFAEAVAAILKRGKWAAEWHARYVLVERYANSLEAEKRHPEPVAQEAVTQADRDLLALRAVMPAHPSPSPEQGEDDLVQRLRGGTMGFDWADLHDDALIPAVPLLREAATAISALRARVAELEARATPPDSDAVRAMKTLRTVRDMLEVEYHDDGRIACVAHESGGLREMVRVLDAALSNQGSSSNGQ